MIKYGLTANNTKILVDQSSPAVVSALKSLFGEETNYISLLNHRKKLKIRDIYYDMAVIPVPFTTANKKDLLLNVKELLDEGLIAINLERHTNLILALRTATATDLILDKEATISDDALDAFSLACYSVKVNRKETQAYDFGSR
jgi:hypothetical protein